MTDLVREAFEKWAKTQSWGRNLGHQIYSDSYYTWVAELSWRAWQQSRREALMEAEKICVSLTERAGCGAITCAEAIRAAAEEVGRE